VVATPDTLATSSPEPHSTPTAKPQLTPKC
jgi:hypothetical protein